MGRYTTCPRCGAEFCKDEPWKKVCLDCWLKSKGKGTQGSSSYVAELRMELDDTRAKLGYYIGRCLQLERELEGKSFCTGLEDHIRDLIFLCHPDKHHNNPKATATTAWLLDVRKEILQ